MLLLVVAGAAVAAVALTVLGFSPTQAGRALEERSPVEMIGHAVRRLEGHPRLQAVLHPPLRWLHARFVQEPGGPLRDLGKGVRAFGLTPQRYDDKGAPLPASPAAAGQRAVAATKLLGSAVEIAGAFDAARAGDVFEIGPGTYALPRTLYTRQGGRADAPITLRAAAAGTVILEVHQVEGVVVAHPHWVFENLGWRGACKDDDACEHAFHIVGDARATVVRNNRLVDFSAHLKINGHQGRYPDDGLLQHSSLVNTRPRVGEAPVTMVDLVAASGWQLLDNHVEGFIKQGSNGVSYGLFMKGAGQRGRIERNVVVCTPTQVGQPGLRLGISLGGGGTSATACRDKRCELEFDGAVVANNVVAHCNDAGIDVNKSRGVQVLHNTLINTQGVLLRNAPAEARVVHNLLDSAVRHRAGTTLSAAVDNRRNGDLARWLVDPQALDLRWREAPEPVATPAEVPLDFCGRRRAALSEPGAGAAAPCGGPASR
ncbi:MAG: hypothetical protein JNL30_00505 [Rubrivivax sp.]|nr:hypothetical protein [Rubrivivax sp.]